jgi:hypothetical protein
MKRLAFAAAAVAVIATGCTSGNVQEDGERWPKVRSYCSPDQPGVRVYETAVVKVANAGSGAAIAVIADTACGGDK